MSENFRDQRRVFNTGDHAQFTAALRTGLDVDGEHPFEALHPAHVACFVRRGRRVPAEHVGAALAAKGCFAGFSLCGLTHAVSAHGDC
jgi:hypothetical protein